MSKNGPTQVVSDAEASRVFWRTGRDQQVRWHALVDCMDRDTGVWHAPPEERTIDTLVTWRAVCSGCGEWAVEWVSTILNGFADRAQKGAAGAAAEVHRAECAAFDMLAGLQGIPV